MKAIGFFEPGGPEVLRFVEVPRPAPQPRDVLVRVRAVSVNPVDTKVRRGRGTSATAPPGEPLIVGWDAAGVVEEACILSCAEAPDFAALASILAFGGEICCILPAPAADLSGLFRKRGRVSFEWMFARPKAGAEPERQGAVLDRVAGLLDRKVLASTMTRVLDWSECRAAHEAIESGHTVGKIVPRVGA